MSERNQIHVGDCRDLLASWPSDCIDSIVTDPPYGLLFMGKGWDRGVPGCEFWEHALRVAKPGAHLLAFGGTRTYHRLACAIEDAGWQIRDCLGWIYGSGFPKSLDVSKAIDKGHGENRERQLQFTAWMRSTRITAEQINEATDSCMGSHYLSQKSQPQIATADMFDKLRPYLPEVPEYIERLVCERTGLEWTAYKARPIVGCSENGIAGGTGKHAGQDAAYGFAGKFNITAPATDAARQWVGWGTALKPAWEPIILARKPLIGTVAHNVLEHGTGGLNIDGCRVGIEVRGEVVSTVSGRWPANIIHDGSDEVEALFPCSVSGSASRFFYCAKASRSERGEGNHHPTVKPLRLMRYLCRLVTPPDGIVLDMFSGSGSTLVAACLERFAFAGCELSPEYAEIAKSRVAAAQEIVARSQGKNVQQVLDL